MKSGFTYGCKIGKKRVVFFCRVCSSSSQPESTIERTGTFFPVPYSISIYQSSIVQSGRMITIFGGSPLRNLHPSQIKTIFLKVIELI